MKYIYLSKSLNKNQPLRSMCVFIIVVEFDNYDYKGHPSDILGLINLSLGPVALITGKRKT